MQKIKVLVADDMDTIREVIKFGLEKRFPNVEVEEAADGMEAKLKLESDHYDLVLCDWVMPDVDGIELLKWVRNHPFLNAMPFVMMTVKDERKSVMQAMQAGVSSYVVKPFTMHLLIRRIKALIDKLERREFERFFAETPISINFPAGRAKGNLIDISMGGILSVLDSSEKLPRILEKVKVDLEPDDMPKVEQIEGVVIRIQAVDPSADSKRVRLAVRFLEISDEKKAEVRKFLDSLE